jgi:hypothetical protein
MNIKTIDYSDLIVHINDVGAKYLFKFSAISFLRHAIALYYKNHDMDIKYDDATKLIKILFELDEAIKKTYYQNWMLSNKKIV